MTDHPRPPSPVMALRAVTCVRGYTTLFDDLDLQLNSGDIVQLQGPNGSGKSSLLRILAGLLQPESGQVLWNNESIQAAETGFNANVAYLSHRLGLTADASVADNLRFAQCLKGRDNPKHRENALAELGLSDLRHRLVRHLSAGQAQRTALAAVLVTHAQLWLLDEPFSALDRSARDIAEAALERHAIDGGLAVVATHQPLSVATANIRTVLLGDNH